MKNMDNWTIRDGKITNEITSERIEKIIKRNTDMITKIDNQIMELNSQKSKFQDILDRVNVFKEQMR